MQQIGQMQYRQNMYRQSNGGRVSGAPGAPGANATVWPFFEIQFARLILWEECQKHVKLMGNAANGGQIFQRYRLPFITGVTMDFCCRGTKLKPQSAIAFIQVLARPHVLDLNELLSMREVISEHWLDPLQKGNRIDHAEVGNLNGKLVLAVEWSDSRRDRKWISVFLDAYGDGKTVKEIHFSSPSSSFTLSKKYFSEVLRSLQWHPRAIQAENIAISA